MQDSLTGDDIFAHILMLRTVDRRAIIVCEGPSDSALLDTHLDQVVAQTIVAHGKANVLKVAQLVRDSSIHNVAGVVDQDHDVALGTVPDDSNVFLVGAADLDTLLLFQSKILYRAALSAGDRTKLHNHLEKAGVRDPAEAIGIALTSLSALRRVCKRDAISLNLANFPVDTVLDCERLIIDESRMISIARARSQVEIHLDDDVLLARIDSIKPQLGDFVSSVNGHDAEAAAAVFMKRSWGAKGGLRSQNVRQLIRAAYSCTDLMTTRIYDQLDGWGRLRGFVIWHCPNCFT